MKAVIVTGSREFTAKEVIWRELAKLRPRLVVHGGARGADSMAEDWACYHNVDSRIFRAKWNGPLGKRAGPSRNQRMLDAFPAAQVLAFITPGCRGTWDCIIRARADRDRCVLVFDEVGKEITLPEIKDNDGDF